MDGNPHESPDFPANPAFVYRALPYDDLLSKAGRVHKDKTFLRHPVRDKNGLSVTASIAACKAQFTREIFGIRRVNVTALRECGLELFPTSNSHANIRFADNSNIPLARGADDPAAREIAAKLMKASEPVLHWEDANADSREAISN